MTKTVIHVVRHGEVDNPDGILYGRLPGYHLTPLGHAMAQRVSEYFRSINADITAVITSPLERAIETGTPTAQLYGLQLTTDERLIEAGNTFQGHAIHNNYWAMAHPRMWKRYVNPLTPSWGEPYIEQAQRMMSAVKTALNTAYGHEAVVVSHQLPIWCLRRYIEGKSLAHDPRKRECALASITRLTFDNHTLVGLTYCEPADDLIAQARDMTPGISQADVNKV